MAGAFLLFPARDLFAKATWEGQQMVSTNTSRVHWHTVTITPSTNAPKIHFYSKLNPVWWLKNSDDPIPPKWYRPNEKYRGLKWSFRNPLHNFHFYVIGVADKKISRSGRFPDKNSDPRGGWDFEAARYKCIWLPFVSYHREKFDFYFGWRNRGNFGIKININPKKGPKISVPPTEGDEEEK